jgi:very-short-patch-repair endonuclease
MPRPRAIAEQTDRAQTSPPAQFDSWLEVDVYLAITARGYRVRPNYDIAGYRIDLVVEGDRRRLAVECDGDEWDGPDAFDRDFARQKQLERCGWTFVRIRGSRFYLDRDGALEELWRTLDEQGIRGAGASERAGDDSP